MSNFTHWHYIRGAGTCGVYEVYDELSGRRYIGSSECCEYRLQLHEQRIRRRSRNIPAGLKALAYVDRPVKLVYRILKAVPKDQLVAAEQAAWSKAAHTATNQNFPSRKPHYFKWRDR